MSSPSTPIDPFHLDPAIRDTWPQENLTYFGQIMRECVDPDPAKRPSMQAVADALKHLALTKHALCVSCGANAPGARLECGHTVVCKQCVTYLMDRGATCPQCRSQIVLFQEGSFSKGYLPI